MTTRRSPSREGRRIGPGSTNDGAKARIEQVAVVSGEQERSRGRLEELDDRGVPSSGAWCRFSRSFGPSWSPASCRLRPSLVVDPADPSVLIRRGCEGHPWRGETTIRDPGRADAEYRPQGSCSESATVGQSNVPRKSSMALSRSKSTPPSSGSSSPTAEPCMLGSSYMSSRNSSSPRL